MSERMETIYKGYTIYYSEINEEFVAEIDDARYSNMSLKTVKKYIDNLEKKNFVRTDVYVLAGYGAINFSKATVTSEIIEDGHMCWITKENGRRSKELVSKLYLQTPENEALMEKVRALQKLSDGLMEKQDDYKAELEHYVPKMSIPK